MKLQELATFFKISYQGDPDFAVNGISSIDNPIQNTVLLVSKPKLVNFLTNQSYAFLIEEKELHSPLPKGNFLLVDNPRVIFAKITCLFKIESSIPKPFIQDNFKVKLNHGYNFTVGKNFKYGVGCKIGNNVIIEDNVLIGDKVILGHNICIHKDTVIGNCVNIDSGTVIGSEGFGNVINSRDEWEHINHLGGVTVGDNVSIGSNCCIDRGTIENTVIGDNVIMDNFIHIAHNVEIGNGTAIAASTAIAGSCKIGRRNLIGGMVGILDHVSTVDEVFISSCSTVFQNIKKPGKYTGFMPVTLHSNWKRIAFWLSKLDKIMRFKKF